MATLNFYLDKADKQGQSFILMTYLAGGQKFRHSVKLKVFPTQWIKRKQRVKELNREGQLINSHLDKLESIIKDAQTHSLLFNHEIDFNFVKDLFFETLGGKRKGMKTFVEAFEEYIEHAKAMKRPKTADRCVTCFNHLKEFRKVKKYELTYERINHQFYEAFVQYLLVNKNQLNNTAGNYIKTLKAFINFSIDRGYCKPNAEVRKFKVLKDDAVFTHGLNVFNQEHVNIFSSHDVTSELRLQKRKKGNYTATAWIPGNLLPDGLFTISIALFTPNPLDIFIHEHEALTFEVFTDFSMHSARGDYAYSFPGVVRPLIPWTAKLKNQ